MVQSRKRMNRKQKGGETPDEVYNRVYENYKEQNNCNGVPSHAVTQCENKLKKDANEEAQKAKNEKIAKDKGISVDEYLAVKEAEKKALRQQDDDKRARERGFENYEKENEAFQRELAEEAKREQEEAKIAQEEYEKRKAKQAKEIQERLQKEREENPESDNYAYPGGKRRTRKAKKSNKQRKTKGGKKTAKKGKKSYKKKSTRRRH